MEGRIIECHSKINGGLDYHNSPLIGEIPTNDYSHYHRSIDQLRSIGMSGAGPQSNGGGGLTYHLHHPPFAEATYPAISNNNNSLERIDYNSGKVACDLMATSVDERTTHISSGSNERLETETNLKHYHNKKYNNNHHHQQQQHSNNSNNNNSHHQQQHHHQQHSNGMRTTTPSPLTAPILTQDSSSILSPPPSLVQPSAATPPHPSAYNTIVVAHHPSSSLSSSSSSSAHTITTRSSVDGPTKEPKVGGHLCFVDPTFFL
jgi:hypothetical protein